MAFIPWVWFAVIHHVVMENGFCNQDPVCVILAHFAR